MRYATLFKVGLLAGVATVGLVPVVKAADVVPVSPAEATVLEQQVRDALGSLVGPSMKLSERPVRITAAGDHYDVLVLSGVKMSPTPGAAPQEVQLTATAKQDEKGIWLIDGPHLPSPLRFTLDMPVPPQPDQAPGTVKRVPTTFTMQQTGSQNRIVWDPSFATPSTSTSSSQSTVVRSEGGQSQTTEIGPVNSVTTLRPAGDGRSDLLLDGGMQDYHLTSMLPNGAVEVGVKNVRVGMQMTGVSRAGSVAILQAMSSVMAEALQAPPTAAGKPPTPPKVAPEAIRAMLAALKDYASDFAMDETFDGFIVKAQGQTVAMDQMKMGFDAKSDAGMLNAGVTLGMQGLVLPDLPLGDMAALIPSRVALHPVVGGIGVAELMKIAQAGSDGHDPAPADIQALFSHGGITGGLQSLTVEMAGATLTGQAKFVATGPSADLISGTAQLTVENYDTMMQKVTAMPALAQQAVPVMVFVKGIGRSVGNTLVYDIIYKDNKVLINGVDLTAMAGGPAAKAAPSPAPAPVPAPGRAPSGPAKGPGRPVPSWAK